MKKGFVLIGVLVFLLVVAALLCERLAAMETYALLLSQNQRLEERYSSVAEIIREKRLELQEENLKIEERLQELLEAEDEEELLAFEQELIKREPFQTIWIAFSDANDSWLQVTFDVQCACLYELRWSDQPQ
ncbi:MAG: hypothetical protein LBR25_08100 [Erysipelotrichaceae bacterium]|jgi:hypothetical protein|nr:hypothetical protein [Erysipelotrichaceae bacterium]